MKKVILLIFVSILLLVAFTACGKECKHEEWTEATCQSAKTCTACGAKEGTALAHQATAATCTAPQQCSVCGFTSPYWQEALGHEWAEASCLRGTAKTCTRCGVTDGDVPDHTWSAPTCTTDSKCSACGLTKQDSALGHNYVEVSEQPATCTSVGYTAGTKCSRCGDVESGVTVIPAIEHKGHEVPVEGVSAGCTTPGLTPGKKCDLCKVFTEPQLTINPIGHQRYTYDDDGHVTADGYVKTEYPTNPATGLPFAKCESDGITTYTCQLCSEQVTAPESKVDHKYPDGATCNDTDAKCEYCQKDIEHEFLDPTCTSAATCKICGEEDATRPAYNHILPGTADSAFAPATCLAPATCTLCGATEGQKLVHKLTFEGAPSGFSYTCSGCNTSFSPYDEYFYLDGATHEMMIPVNNSFGGYETHKDANGVSTHLPVIKTDDNGDSYFSLIKVKDPDLQASGEAYPPQVQLWLPMQRGGFTGFTSSNAAVGFLSFSMNAYMDKNFSLTFVEGGGWTTDDVIRDFFVLTPVTEIEITDDASGETTKKSVIQILAIDDGDAATPRLVLFEKDVTGLTAVDDLFTGWLDVYIGIVLDDATDTISLHYYIDGMYRGTATVPLTTAGNGIKCIYVSGNTNANGSGLMIDDIAFGYTANGYYQFDSEHEHVYNVLSEEVLPTCTNDGYRIYACDCGVIGTRTAIPTLGHIVHSESEVLPTCTEAGHSAYSYCTREDCGAVLVARVDYPANGHDYVTSADKAATCTKPGGLRQKCSTCGYDNVVQRPALGHEYPLDADCERGATCIRCGTSTSRPIGHVYSDATCTDPETCMREGCNVTNGEALGHDLTAPTCTDISHCTRCEYSEGEKLHHTLEVKYVKSVITYVCTGCNATFQFKNGYTLNGSGTSNMAGTGNSTGYTVTTGTQLPSIVDGHYEFLHSGTNKSQLQLWVPVADNSADFGFSAANKAVGVLSFKMNAYMSEGFDVKLIDGSSNTGSSRWTAAAVAGRIAISSVSNGKVTFSIDTVDPSTGAYVNNHVIAEVAVGSDNFTGWVDIVVGIVLDPVTDQITYHCYADGEYVLSFSTELTTKTNSFNCIYISGYTSAKDSGIMFDDFAFGYTANGTWVFDECRHEGTAVVTPPTCTTDGYTTTVCDKCGHIAITDVITAFGHTEAAAPDCEHGYLCATCGEYYGEALGHTGGKATCDKQPICDRCGDPYGSPAHTVVEATCTQGSYCSECNEVFSDKVSHKPVYTVSEGIVTFKCKFCEVAYVLEQAYVQDANNSLGNYVPVLEDGSYVLDESNGKFNFNLTANPKSNGKAWVWFPSNASGQGDFTNFKQGAVGVLSFSLDVFTDTSFEVHLMDTDHRGGGTAGSFWDAYTMQKIFHVTPPDDSNVVSINGWGNTLLKTVTVTNENKYTGMFDVTIGIELNGGKITFHYYLDGQYVTSVTDDFKIASNKIDGVVFLGQSKTIGSGYTLSNVAFGYAQPYGGNLAPAKPKD